MEQKTSTRGGARPGAGRKPQGEESRTGYIGIRVTDKTERKYKALLQATRNDEATLPLLFSKWIDSLAETYGITL